MLGELQQNRANRWAAMAVAVSALIGLYVRATEGFVPPVADAASYVRAASGLSTHPALESTLSWSVGSMAMRGITYPLLIATLLTLAGSLAAVVWFQSLVLVPATVALLFLTGRRAFSAPVGLVAAWWYALWVPAQIYSSLLMQETWLSFLVALLLYLLSRCVTGGGWRVHLAAGLLLGCLAVTHSAFQFVGVATIVALAVHRWRYRDQRPGYTLLLGLGLVAILLPSMVIRGVYDLPQQGEGARGYGGGGGWTFWIGSNPALGFRQPVDGNKFAELTAEGEFAEVLRQVRAGELATDPNLTRIILAKSGSADLAHEKLTDADFYRAGIANLLSDPGAWPRKAARGLNTLMTVPAGLAYYRSAPSAAAPGAPWQFLSYTLFVVGFAGVFLIAASRRSRLILAVPFLVQFSVLLAAFPENRHVIPLWGSLFLFGAVTVERIAQALPRLVSAARDPRPTIVVAGFVGGSLVLTASAVSATQSTPVPQASLPQSRAEAVFDRETLRRLVLGNAQLPADSADTQMWRASPAAVPLAGAAATRQSEVPLRFGLHSTLTEYQPARAGNCGLIVHGGHGPWAIGGGLEVAEAALRRGCRVIAIDMPGQGVNAGQSAVLPAGGRVQLRQPDDLHNAFGVLDTTSRMAMDLFIVPVTVAVDHLHATGADPLIMAGLSGGGWTTALSAASDPRISRSLAVAGSTTVDPDQPCDGDYEQCQPRLYSQMPMESIYALAATGPGREHVQVLNYYDPCCYANNDGSAWVAQVQQSVTAIGAGGRYVFIADRTEPGLHAYPPAALDVLDEWLDESG